jgi:superfamily II DNA or RNA helicase
MVLKNMGVSDVPSPINKDYKWHGIYKPFNHQKETAGFLTLHKRAYCLNEMGCVDSETEYLSPIGWVKIADYAGGEVAQYHPDSREIEFVEPLEFIKKPCVEMIRFKTARGVDQLLSPEHRMVIHDKASKEGKWVVHSAAEMLGKYEAKKKGISVPRSKAGVGISHAAVPVTYKRPWGATGIQLTDAQIRVQVAVIADGSFSKRNDNLTCVVRIKKERKVHRLIGLLAEAGIAYSVTQTKDGYHVFRFKAPLKCKVFYGYFWSCTTNQIKVIYDEVLHWDGCFREGARLGEFTSTSKESADFIQAVFNSNGHVASLREDRREGKYKQGVCYTVIVRQRSEGLLHISGNNTENESIYTEPSTDGFKYCFSVPSTFLLFRRNGCVFASGNTGKSASVLWAADYLMEKGYIKRVLVVCPLSIMHSAWKADAFRTIMHRSVGIAHGTKDVRESVIKGHSEIVVINYDGICSVMDAIDRADFDLIVIDEYNHYKNAQTRRWKAMNKLVKANTWLWGLTGSPASQLPTDAYGLAKLMNPSSVPKFYNAFRDDVMLKVTQFKYVPRQNAMDMVFKVLQPAIRYTKEECLDLPPRMYITREVPMSAQQKKYYKLLKEQMIIEAAGEEISTANAAVNLSKLLQIASGNAYSDNKEVIEFDCSSRQEALLDIIEEASKKVIVFATFRHSISMLEDLMKRNNISVGVIHGQVSLTKRSALVEEFQSTSEPRVLILQPRSASHGITLTAANVVVWWTPTPSVETYLQANDRVHRAGQDAPCTVIHLCGSPVEERFYKTLEHKGNLLDDLLGLYKDVLTL